MDGGGESNSGILVDPLTANRVPGVRVGEFLVQFAHPVPVIEDGNDVPKELTPTEIDDLITID